MDLISDKEDLYEETEFVIEEQDLRVLKAIISDDKTAREFVNKYDHNLFLGSAKSFAEKVITYYKKYNLPPTKRVMLESANLNQELISEIEFIWDELEKVKYNKSEFNWDLDKIKDRFAGQKIKSIREIIEKIDSEKDVNGQLINIRANLDAAERIKRKKESAYTQKTLKDYMPEFRDDFVRKSKDSDLGKGLITGYSYLDYVTNGLSPADMLIIGGETGAGKMCPLNTLLPTPSGFKHMKDVHPGDVVFGLDGKPCNVVAESEVLTAPGWEFEFDDGSKVISHDNHEWLIFKNNCPKKIGSIKITKEIVETLLTDGVPNHSIPVAEAIDLPTKELLIDPYLLGCWLGGEKYENEGIIFYNFDVINCFDNANYSHYKRLLKKNKYDDRFVNVYWFDGLNKKLEELNILKNEHIPFDYLWSSKQQRLALLQGLMDTGGFVAKNGRLTFVSSAKNIIESVAFLIRSLGEKCIIKQDNVNRNFKIMFSPIFSYFKTKNEQPQRVTTFRSIKNAVRVSATPMKCIQVDSNDHLYLVSKYFIPTHNSMLLNNMAIQMWLQGESLDLENKGANVQYFSLEMPYDQCARRTMARLSGISTYALRDCQITDHNQLSNLAKAANFIKKFPFDFEIVDIPRGVTVRAIEERYLEAVARGRPPEVVAIDYLGLMESEEYSGVDDWLKLGQIAGQLHEFSRTYNVAVLTAVQLNRPKGKSPDEIIGLHRIGRSSLIMHHATVGVQIETRIDESTFDDIPYHIIKNRNGEQGQHLLKKRFRCATVVDMKPYVPMQDDGVGDFSAVVPAMEDISKYLDKYGWDK